MGGHRGIIFRTQGKCGFISFISVFIFECAPKQNRFVPWNSGNLKEEYVDTASKAKLHAVLFVELFAKR